LDIPGQAVKYTEEQLRRYTKPSSDNEKDKQDRASAWFVTRSNGGRQRKDLA
jgi:hypothetical protein